MSTTHNIVSTRFIKCLNTLKEEGAVRSYRQFALNTSIHPQSLNEILKGKRNVTIDMIKSAVEKYYFNPLYIYLGKGTLFLDASGALPGKNKVITVVTDNLGEERITYVPAKAQAGYGDSLHDPCFFQDLETFSLPGQKFMSRTKRCFDVEGGSMEPSIPNRAKVVAAFVEQETWITNVRSQFVYVVVTKDAVFLKRVENQLKTNAQLVLHSDNPMYPPVTLEADEIEEIWILETVIEQFNHRANKEQKQIENLEQEILEKNDIINRLKAEIEALKKETIYAS